MELGQRIEKVMLDNNLNYRSLGAKLEYSDTQVRKIIKGTSIPKVDFIQSLVRIFPDVSIDWLLFGKEDGKAIDISSANKVKEPTTDEVLRLLELLFFHEEELIEKYPIYSKWSERKELKAYNNGAEDMKKHMKYK